ncbi:hypothetical protein Psch_03234 [Pelotomaculum schinkii]|uniref:LysM domain-containing protein n=1 Tax=Pelotomaculum schinkii TaxID=78350 RepID=A0A4Y7RBU8_9FIRM|nr:DUF2680 domain-containing protein [Pelotomaculum schinkii]TEB06190.1 hypothetical protein Psch_03234 [Pelotomaculum schinkii]
MLKLHKNMFIGVLSAGLLLGGTALFNVSTANAASPGKSQQMIGFQTGMGGQGQPTMMFQLGAPMRQQPNQQQKNQQQFNKQQVKQLNQKPVQQQPVQQQPVQQQQPPIEQFAQGGQMCEATGGNLISQVAAILDVDEQTIIAALQSGQTLVEIAEDYDVSEDELLEQLEELQSDAIDDAVDAGILTDDQADTLKEQLSERLEQIVEGINTMPNNNVGSNDASVSDIENTLDNYFEDAGDNYFGDDGIDVTISLDGDEDDLAYRVTLDFDDAVDYEDLTDISQTKLKTFLSAVKSKIKAEIADTDLQDADIMGKAVDNDNSSYYVEYDGSSYTFSWDD